MDELEHAAAASGIIVGMDEWTDLDDAYLDIFGEHPDLEL